jgi:hypothetical protein
MPSRLRVKSGCRSAIMATSVLPSTPGHITLIPRTAEKCQIRTSLTPTGANQANKRSYPPRNAKEGRARIAKGDHVVRHGRFVRRHPAKDGGCSAQVGRALNKSGVTCYCGFPEPAASGILFEE